MFLSTVFKSFKPVFRSQTAIISSFSTKHQEGGAKPWKERDSAHEKDFFNKEDEKAMRKLLNKMSAKVDPAAHEKEAKTAAQEVEELFKKHGVQGNAALFHDLVTWRFSH